MMIPRIILLPLLLSSSTAFVVVRRARPSFSPTLLHVSIGLGPQQKEDEQKAASTQQDPQKVAGVDYLIPNHEEYRTSRRSKLDERCDAWFEALLNSSGVGCLGALAEQARSKLTTPVELINEIEQSSREHTDWTPYVSTKLPWTPLTPAYGLEQFGLPIPRRGAEAWRHFDVAGMVAQDYSSCMKLEEDLDLAQVQRDLEAKGSWLSDEKCEGRLVYVNGVYIPELSKVTPNVYNLDSCPAEDSDLYRYLSRLTDGFSDELLAVDDAEQSERSFQRLSGPNHKVGPPTLQFAINTQQGTACFAALNTILVNHVAVVRSTPQQLQKQDPVLIVQALTPNAGLATNGATAVGQGRVLAIAESESQLSLIQSQVDVLDDGSRIQSQQQHTPKLFNSFTQIIAHESSNVTYGILEETGGLVTPQVEVGDDEISETMSPSPREIEAARPQLQDTIFNTIDAQIHRRAALACTVVQMGGSGRSRLALSASLLQSGANTEVKGFCLSGGTQRCDVRTNIQHIAPATTSRQFQKNLMGGRSTTSFRGRIRVEQDAQQTDSQQLSRAILLTDKARAWAVPSLEIIADDVKCSHGTTVSDLSEEELFYLTSRGIDRTTARKLLMYAFASDIVASIQPEWRGKIQDRVLTRLENLVPKGDRAVKGEFQSI